MAKVKKFNTIDIYKKGNKYYQLKEPVWSTTRKEEIKAEQILTMIPSPLYSKQKFSTRSSKRVLLKDYHGLKKATLPDYYIHDRRKTFTKPKNITVLDRDFFKKAITKNGLKGLLNSIVVRTFIISGRKYYDLYSKVSGNWIGIDVAKNKEEAVKPYIKVFK